MRLFIFGMLLVAGTVACGGEEEVAEPTKAEEKAEKKEAKAEAKAEEKAEEKAEAPAAAPAKAKGGKAKGGN